MSNMSYCRFQNTLGDLRDCKDALNGMMNLEQLSDDEQEAARLLIRLCREIGEDWDEDA